MQSRNLWVAVTILVVVVFTGMNPCFGQMYWEKTLEVEGHFAAISPTGDGNYLIAGFKSFNFPDGWLLKIKPSGDTLWTKTYGKTAAIEKFSAIQPTSDGNFILAGYIQTSENIMSPSSGWLVKVNNDGDTIWTRSYGNEDCRNAFSAITLSVDGNFLIAGSTENIVNRTVKGWLVKINQDGDTIWTKTYEGLSGGWFTSIQTDSNEYIMIVGFAWTDEDLGNGWVLKANPDGTILWSRTFGGGGYDDFAAIQSIDNGCFLIVGSTSPNSTSRCDGWIVKIKPNGDSLWMRTYDAGFGDDWFNNIQSTRDGNFIIAGAKGSPTTSDDGWLLKINPDGDTLWTKTCSKKGLDWYSIIQSIGDGNFLLIGDGSISCFIDDQYAYQNSLFKLKIPTYGVDSLNCGYLPVNVPPGMTVSTGGTISWTPKTDSVYMEHAEFLVIDDLGNRDTFSLNVFVNSGINATVTKKVSRVAHTMLKSMEIVTNSSHGKVIFSLPLYTSDLCIYDITGRMVDRIVPVASGSNAYAVWTGGGSGRFGAPMGKYYARAHMGNKCVVKPFLLYK